MVWEVASSHLCVHVRAVVCSCRKHAASTLGRLGLKTLCSCEKYLQVSTFGDTLVRSEIFYIFFFCHLPNNKAGITAWTRSRLTKSLFHGLYNEMV